MPVGVLLVCAIALPQALARSSHGPASAMAADGGSARALAMQSARIAAALAAARARSGTGDGIFERVATHAAQQLQRDVAAAARRRLAPLVVRRVIAAGNRIARAPYSYGGGHGNWNAGAYDCSGSVSYALHGGGLLDTALASGDLMSWGAPGPGRWITIYANGGHAFMVVAGRRFDTTGREQTGSRWQSAMRDTTGYVVRHPPGL